MWVTRHGPLFVTEGSDQMALRWVAADARGLLQYPMLDIDRAQNWQRIHGGAGALPRSRLQFRVCRRGRQHRLSRRRQTAASAWAHRATCRWTARPAKCEWDGFIPFEQLPAYFNPPGGIIVTANQNPVSGGLSVPGERGIRAADRLGADPQSAAIAGGLEGRRPAGSAEATSTRPSTISWPASWWRPTTAAGAYPALDPVIALLRGWNGQMDKELAARPCHRPGLSSTCAWPWRSGRRRIRLGVRRANWRARWWKSCCASVRPAGSTITTRCCYAPWWTPWTKAGACRDATSRVWQYGRWMRIGIDHPVTHQVPVVGKYFDIAPVPISGSTTTVQARSPVRWLLRCA